MKNNIKDITNLIKLDNTDFLNNKEIKIKNSNYIDKKPIIASKEKLEVEKDNNGIVKLGKYYIDKDYDNNEDFKDKKGSIKIPHLKLNKELLNIIKKDIQNFKNIKNESKNIKIYKKKKVINHNFNIKQNGDEKNKIKSNGNINNDNLTYK